MDLSLGGFGDRRLEKGGRSAGAAGVPWSVRWLEAARAAGQVTGAARVRVVADREVDMFALFAHRPEHVHLLVRALHDHACGQRQGEAPVHL
ncbi:MAG: hypothetical protein KDJ83_04655 [Rhodobacteraceae bacterium]|nr:hypothetical protein [Paracoccaceae bacterium]